MGGAPVDGSRRSTEKLRALMDRCGKSFADVEAAGSIRPAQMELLRSGAYGGLRVLTLVDLADILGCSLTDVIVALGRD